MHITHQCRSLRGLRVRTADGISLLSQHQNLPPQRRILVNGQSLTTPSASVMRLVDINVLSTLLPFRVWQI